MSLPVPYPADVRAKGWRFELDHERIRKSDTWALAPAEIRPWLLMLWMTAWEQSPCGSLPNSDELIAAHIGMPSKVFAKHKDRLMRGWWEAEDGRLYHGTLVERVTEMLAAKDKERTRKAEYRRRMDAERAAASQGDPNLSHGTDTGQTQDSHGSDPGRDDTGTGTGTGFSSSLRSEEISTDTGSTDTEQAKPAKRAKHDYTPEFEAAWAAYPERPGNSKADAFKAWKARIATGATANDLTRGVERYAAYVAATRTEPQFVKQASTFFGPGEHYLEKWTALPTKPRSTWADKQTESVRALTGGLASPQTGGATLELA